MRTTLTLDDDVAAMLRRAQKARKTGLKETVNAALREGLPRMVGTPAKRPRYGTKPMDLGPCLLPNLDNSAEVLAIIDGESYK